MKQFKLLNNVFGWLSFLIATTVYIMTLEPTTSFWDCGEFITTAYKIQVGHPPGAPFFMILARFFSIFASGPDQVAYMINLMSALASSFTILLLFWTITHFARKMVAPNGEFTTGKYIAILGSGLVGALAYTFSDTFWFSAVEAEVYASSSLFTALVFWAILKWEDSDDRVHANRWLILIAYLMGLSIGVHLLNLLAIPAIVFVYYFKKYPVTRKGLIYASLISVLILGTIMYGIIPYLVVVASWFELLFVNGFGLPFNSGNIFYIVLLLSAIVYGLYYTHKHGKVLANTIVLATTVIIIGYSSFAMIVIRSYANPPMDQNSPETVFKLLSYLNREQYGDRPLFYGQSFNSPLDNAEPSYDGDPIYIKQGDKYVVSDYKEVYNYDDRFKTLFPRMWSPSGNHVSAYKKWSGFKGRPVQITNRSGEQETIYKPTFGENLRYLFNYQLNWMYWRYFMWNFSGRQNDIQGHDGAPGRGEVTKGNWISGISFIDDARLGPQDQLPSALKENKGRNKYYMLPFLLGLLGMYVLYRRGNKDFWVTFLLFIFTGVAIVFYLNQHPYQPRERDYAYAGSFYAYAIFIGIGVLGIIRLLQKAMPHTASAALATGISLLAVPVLMASENWDDHDRSNRYTARDFAINYLESCAPNAIIFTNGDNDTFPLWYAQEVEGVRPDIRVCNLSYLSTDWYIDQMKRKAYDSDPVPFSLTHDQYVQGTRDYIPVFAQVKDYRNIKQIIDFVASDNPASKFNAGGNQSIDYLPSKKLSLPIDSAKIMENGIIPAKYAAEMTKEIRIDLDKSYILKNELMVLDLIANFNWERPVYFAITVGRDSYVNLEEYFMLEGLAYRFAPIKTPVQGGQIGKINTEAMYDNMMHKFVWGNMNHPDVYLDENNQRMLMNFRSNFGRLGLDLLAEGEREKAIAVADKAIELMPDEIVPYNYFNVSIAEIYYRTDFDEKGNAIIQRIYERMEEELSFYAQLNDRQFQGVYNDARRALALMQELSRVSRNYGQSQLSKEIENGLILHLQSLEAYL